jgi:hypothetical protein
VTADRMRHYFVFDPRYERGLWLDPVGQVTPDLPGGEGVCADTPGQAKAQYLKFNPGTEYTELRVYRMYPCNACQQTGKTRDGALCDQCGGSIWQTNIPADRPGGETF